MDDATFHGRFFLYTHSILTIAQHRCTSQPTLPLTKSRCLNWEYQSTLNLLLQTQALFQHKPIFPSCAKNCANYTEHDAQRHQKERIGITSKLSVMRLGILWTVRWIVWWTNCWIACWTIAETTMSLTLNRSPYNSFHSPDESHATYQSKWSA